MASRVAALLLDRGVGPGDRVGVCLRKSPEAVASLFGIMQAGAVFVPLDPAAPAARQTSIISDCSARALVGEQVQLKELMERIPADRRPAFALDLSRAPAGPPPAGPPVPIPVLSRLEALSAPAHAAPVSRSPVDLAYILYTSGSTGMPKGVMISHENALAFTSWACRRFAVSPGDRVTSVAPFHFDLSTFDLYSTLEGGATVLLVPRQTTLFPAALAEFLERSRATITYLVPSTLTGMVLRGDLASRKLDALRTILFAGEVLPARSLAALMKTLPRVALFNLYGPTETNVCSYYEVRPEDKDRERPVPIGGPASGDVLFAVDEEDRPLTGPGGEGELCAAGPTVALGYWSDPDRSGRQFLDAHPQGPQGCRVYRTGDIVSRDPSGNWIYHGRRDHQVKSRGYRIELGEIEAALNAHPAVAEAVAVAVADEEIGNKIKGCVALRDGPPAPDAAALQRHCAERLPRYMVPEHVEILPALPKTSTGKVDRARLAASGWRANGR